MYTDMLVSEIRKLIPSIAEMPRNTEVERGYPEQQMATHQRGNKT
jgi:hypothetical protein